MKKENWEIYCVKEGEFLLDGGSMFGIVPFELWKNKAVPDEKGRIKMAANCLVLKNKNIGKTILINGGIGTLFIDKAIYNISAGFLVEELDKVKIEPDDVTDIIITHLHFDHCGGFQTQKGSFPFKGAKIHLQKNQWEWANNHSIKDKGSYIPNIWQDWKQSNIIFHDGEWNINEQLSCITVEGHTPSMQLPKLSTQEGTVLFLSDLIPTAAHLKPAWNMAYDNYPLQTVEEKIKILAQAYKEKWILIFEHDPDITAAVLIEEEKKNSYKYKQISL